MVRVIEASAPTRIDLAGGTLDIWPLYLFHPGAVTVNVAIDRRASCRVKTGAPGLVLESRDTRRKVTVRDVSAALEQGELLLLAWLLRALGVESGLEVVTQARVPAGSGLGGSSALAVAVAAAVGEAVGSSRTADEILPLVRDAEAQCIGVPTGVQDYLAALHGGVLAVRLAPGLVRAERLGADPARVEERLALFDAGATRFSGINNWEVFKARVEGQGAVREALADIAEAARQVADVLGAGRYEEMPRLLETEWAARKRLAPEVTTPGIDRIALLARGGGGAAKVCGAGGGGMVAVWAEPDRLAGITAGLRQEGFLQLGFRLDLRGLEVESSALP